MGILRVYKEREFTKPENHVSNLQEMQQDKNATSNTGGTFGMTAEELWEAYELNEPETWEAEPF
tara:strand:+ start:449 stop:640 length:192 start_codon:yes stop_codon:yes gene_type:complete